MLFLRLDLRDSLYRFAPLLFPPWQMRESRKCASSYKERGECQNGGGEYGAIKERFPQFFSFRLDRHNGLYYFVIVPLALQQMRELRKWADPFKKRDECQNGGGKNVAINERISRLSSLGLAPRLGVYYFSVAPFAPWKMRESMKRVNYL